MTFWLREPILGIPQLPTSLNHEKTRETNRETKHRILLGHFTLDPKKSLAVSADHPSIVEPMATHVAGDSLPRLDARHRGSCAGSGRNDFTGGKHLSTAAKVSMDFGWFLTGWSILGKWFLAGFSEFWENGASIFGWQIQFWRIGETIARCEDEAKLQVNTQTGDWTWDRSIELVHSNIVNKGSGAWWPADTGVSCDFFPLLFRAILGLPGFGGSARRVKVRKKKMTKMMKKSKRMWLDCTVLGNMGKNTHMLMLYNCSILKGMLSRNPDKLQRLASPWAGKTPRPPCELRKLRRMCPLQEGGEGRRSDASITVGCHGLEIPWAWQIYRKNRLRLKWLLKGFLKGETHFPVFVGLGTFFIKGVSWNRLYLPTKRYFLHRSHD